MRTLRAFPLAVLSLALLAAACGSGGGESPAQAKASITTTWEKFFDPSIPVAQKPDLIQNGPKLKPVLETQSTNPVAKLLKATVKSVVVKKDKADVRYSLVNAKTGDVLLPDSGGQALKIDGKWKVSQSTFCGLVSAGGGHC